VAAGTLALFVLRGRTWASWLLIALSVAAAFDEMVADDVRRIELEREEGIVQQRPHVVY
jgi:hypothetical protein